MAKSVHGSKSRAVRDYLATNPGANPQTVVDELKRQGIDVSFALASAIKYGKKKKKVVSKGSARTAEPGTKKVSGSESIRQYIAAHPEAKANEIVQGLKEGGVSVSAGLVSSVKYGKGQKKTSKLIRTRTSAAGASAASPSTSPSAMTINQLLEVKRLSDTLGGTESLRQALETLDRLR